MCAMALDPVDVHDRKIIDQLRIDGRRSFGEIGRYVGLSEGSVRQRYRRLLELGVVQVVGMPNGVELGYLEAHLSVRVRGVAVDSVARALAALPEVTFVGTSIGGFDLSVDVRFDDRERLNDFLTTTIRRLHGVESVETSTILEVVKDEYMWSGFREAVDRPTRPYPPAAPAI
jgi:Lrp/AsnC family transcriptional regulator, regulator for asnA, asnC and gidA